jgi:hypothetical protein
MVPERIGYYLLWVASERTRKAIWFASGLGDFAGLRFFFGRVFLGIPRVRHEPQGISSGGNGQTAPVPKLHNQIL